jgi:YD repeat-containing protein
MLVKKSIYVLALMLCAIEATSQVQSIARTKTSDYNKSEYYSNFTPQNPQSSALGKFGNTPINYFTRLPEVSINLMTLSSRELSVPISLNYDATGVRLDDIASAVGLKWNLDAGGYVARQANGFADEDPDKGYWKYQSELNSSSIDQSTWVQATQQNTRDSEPDEFVITIPGRSIRFWMKDLYTIIPVPYQRVIVVPTVVNSKLTKFVVTTEDGTTYEFGGTTSSVEERKVETLNLYCNFEFNYKADQYYFTDVNYGHAGWRDAEYFFFSQPEDEPSKINRFDFTELPANIYNSKWYLTKITSPGNDYIHLNYVKENVDTKYATQPTLTHKELLMNFLDLGYSYMKNVPVEQKIFEKRYEDVTFPHDNWRTPAIAKYDNSCLDEKLNCSSNPGGQTIPITATSAYFDPATYKSLVDEYPQVVSSNQSLITESVIRLSSITSSIGSRVEFTASLRQDLPNSFKYDEIHLYNLDNSLIKTIKFRYSTVNALITNDYMWLMESFMMSRIDLTGTPAKSYYANECGFAPSAITLSSSGENNSAGINYAMKKYTLEGLQNYNFKRLFLDAITEYANGVESTVNTFEYSNRDQLRRRLSPVQSALGFGTAWDNSNHTKDVVLFPTTNKAKIMSPFFPSENRLASDGLGNLGILEKITYPTGGFTKFYFTTFPSLTKIEDYTQANALPVSRKEIVGVSGFIDFSNSGVLTSFENYLVSGSGVTAKYKRYKISTSYLQNRYTNLSHGVRRVYNKVRVYNGLSTDHKGYEEYIFKTDGDTPTDVYASPRDVNSQGVAIDFQQNVFPFPKKKENLLRGLLDEHIVYDKLGRPLLSEKNYYEVNPNSFQPATLKLFTGGQFPSAGAIKSRWARPEISGDWIVLSKKTETVSDQLFPDDVNKRITKISDFTYYSGTLTLAQTSTYNEAQPSVKTITKTRYAIQYFLQGLPPVLPVFTDALVLMFSKNQINAPVEIQTLIEDSGVQKLTSAVVYKYKKQGSGLFAKPVEVWGTKSILETTGTQKYNEAYVDASTGTFTIDENRMKKLHSFDTYNAAGNILQQTTKDGIVSAYAWDGTNSLIRSSTISPGGALQQITTYQHLPGIGLSYTIDANDRKTSFEYDPRNRLKITRDHDLNIINRYRYHFAGEADNQMGFTYLVNEFNTFHFMMNAATEAGSQYSWDCGNGSVVENSNYADCSYPTSGQYTVKLVVANPEYPTTVSSQVITVLPPVTIATVGTNSAINICSGPGAKSVTLNASVSGSYTYQWLYRRSGYGGNWLNIGTNASTLLFDRSSVNGSVNELLCKIIDSNGNFRYSNFAYVNYYCTYSDGSSPGPDNCPAGTTWNSDLGQCMGTCPPGCTWNTATQSCNCQ